MRKRCVSVHTYSNSAAGLAGGGVLGSIGHPVAQIEVGPSHFAFLLEDGRICRLPFSVISDRLDLSKTSGGSSGTNSGSGTLASVHSSGNLGPSGAKSAKTSHAQSASEFIWITRLKAVRSGC